MTSYPNREACTLSASHRRVLEAGSGISREVHQESGVWTVTHGRKLPPAELLDRVTGQELAVAPFMRYLRGKLADAGVLTSAPR